MTEPEKFYYYEDGVSTEIWDIDALNKKLAMKSDARLRMEAALLATTTTAKSRHASTMAQMELDRRAAEEAAKRAENLATRTTLIATSVGALATIVGAVLGATLSG